MKFLTAALFACCLPVVTLQAQNFVNGQAARAEFGQWTFTFGGATPGTTATLPNQQIIGGAAGVAWANGTLFVADSNLLGDLPYDNRVLMFNTSLVPAANADTTNVTSYSTYQCNVCAFPAYNQLGQPGWGAGAVASSSTPNAFNVGLSNSSNASNLSAPTAVASDGVHLAVADTNNNRVLIWNSIPTSFNQPADLVLGQSNFTSGGTLTNPTSSSMRGPRGVWLANGMLYVADTQDNRVMIWTSMPTSNNQAANIVLGEPDFGSNGSSFCYASQSALPATANELCNPASVTADTSHIYVADLGFNRVLVWDTINPANGQNADVVVGQPNMTSSGANNYIGCIATGPQIQCERNLNSPTYALSDGTRLYVADGGNDRVLVFNTIPTSNGTAASNVLGEPNFKTDNVSSASITITSTAVDTFSAVDLTPTPTSLAWDGTNLYVADPLDNRILVFTPGNTDLPDSSIVNWASQIIRQEGVVTISVASGGSITAKDTVTLTLGSNTYTYTVVSGDTVDTIAQGLVALVNKGNGDSNAIAFFAGSGTGSFYLSSRGTNLSYDSIAFTVASSNTSNEVATASGNGYLTAGTAATGAPGMLVAITGTNLSDIPASSPVTAALTGTIPTSLGGAQVFFDGIAGPVYSASATQIVSQIPYNLFARNSTSVVVRTTHNDGSVTVTNASPIYIADANPGIFDAPATSGQQRPWPATGVYHQPGNPQAVVDLTGTVNAGDVLTIKIANARSYSYTVKSTDSLATVVASLVAAINNGNDSQVTAEAGAAFDRVVVVARNSGATGGNGIAVTTSTSSSAKITLTAYTSTTCCNVSPGTAVTDNNPAAPGETITISAAGLGIVSNLAGTRLIAIPTGQPYIYDQPNSAYATVSATLGSTTAQVVGGSLAPNSYGVYSVQLIIPEGQATNASTNLYIAQNAFVSNTVTIPVGAANPNPNAPPVGSSEITMSIDSPNGYNQTVAGVFPVAGWAVDNDATVTSVALAVDGVSIADATYGGSRPDVCAANPNTASCANGNTNVGYNYGLDTTAFADGQHNLSVTVTDSNGLRLTHGQPFKTTNYGGSNNASIGIDSPSSNNATFQGVTTFSGWALDNSAPLVSITYSVDGVTKGSLNYGSVSRPDVCAIYSSSPACSSGTSNVGWSLVYDTTALSNGTHVFAVNATASNGDRNIQAHSFTVANWSTGNPIVVDIDSPNAQSSALSGAPVIGGWIIDPDSGIASVSVAVDGIPVGTAGYHGYRPDACAYMTAPDCPNVGWSYTLDTTTIADGSHTLAITVLPYSGQGVTQTVPFRVANMGSGGDGTFVNVDQPNSASAAFSGLAAFGGWAFNTSGSIQSVEIYVDGLLNGYAIYGGDRSDVCAKFTSATGCPDVGWNYLLDTSSLSNGAHAMQAIATASNGQRSTAGSAFTVSNSASTSPTTVSIAQPTSASSPYQGLALISGTAMGTTGTISSITVSVDGYPYGPATFTSGAANSQINWTYTLNTVQFADGNHTVTVTARASDGTSAMASVPLVVANWKTPSATLISIDQPNAQSGSFSNTASFGGWSLNPNTTIASITVMIDGISYGAANIGGYRSDVCAIYSSAPGCPYLGWNFAVDTTLLSNGTHTLSLTATTTAGQSTTTSTSFVVAN